VRSRASGEGGGAAAATPVSAGFGAGHSGGPPLPGHAEIRKAQPIREHLKLSTVISAIDWDLIQFVGRRE
jgi:hypothetical protein